MEQEQIYSGKQNNQAPVIGYRPLTSYGRHIFRLCLNTALSGARLAHTSRLPALFVPNDERLIKIIKQINQRELSPEKRLRSIATDAKALQEYHWQREEQVSIDVVISAGQLVLQTYLEMNPELPEKTSSLMHTILQQNEEVSHLGKLRQFERLATAMDAMNRTNGPLDQDDPFQVVLSLVRYVAHPSFRTRSWRGLQRGDE